MKKKLMSCLALGLFISVGASPSFANLYYTDYGGSSSTLAMGRNDDGSSSRISLGFDLDFYNNTFDSLYINNNGNVTFNSPMSTYTPYVFPNSGGQPIIAPYFADVDTRPSNGGQVYYDTREVNIGGNTQQEFIVTWDSVGYYSYNTSPLNTFQMIIQDDGDVGFSYDNMGWTRGDVSSSHAAAGFDAGNNQDYLLLDGSFQSSVAQTLANTEYWFHLPQSGEGSGDGGDQQAPEDRNLPNTPHPNGDNLIPEPTPVSSAHYNFTTENHSMWSSDQAIVIDETLSLGPDYHPDPTTNSYLDGHLTVGSSVDFQAQLNAHFDMSTGDIDIAFPVDITHQTSTLQDGSVQISTSYATGDVNLSTRSPDANWGVSFDYEFGVELSATLSIGPFSWDLIPPIPSASGSIEIVPESSIYAEEGHEGWSVLDAVGLGNEYVNLQLYPLTGPILTEATTLDGAGNLHSYGESNSVLDGELDLDSVAVSLIGTATGTPIPANILGGSYELDSNSFGFVEGEYFNFSYETIDAGLGAELSLFQDFTFDPNLTVAIEASTGETLFGALGDTFTFNAPENGQNIEFVATYSLNSSTLTNLTGLTGTADINLTVGELTAEWNHWFLSEGNPDSINMQLYENGWDLGDFDVNIFSNSFSMAEDAFPTYIDGWVYDYSSSDQIAMNEINEGWYTDILWGEQFDDVGSWNVDGTAYVIDNALHLETHSPTYAYTDYIVPNDAQTLTFDYYAQDTIAEDQLYLWWNDDILFSLTGDTFGSDWMRTGFIDISNYAGQSGLLTIGLLSPTGRESSFIIDNINFYSSNPSSEPVPEPATMLLFGTGLAGLAGSRIRRKKKA